MAFAQIPFRLSHREGKTFFGTKIILLLQPSKHKLSAQMFHVKSVYATSFVCVCVQAKNFV